MPTLTERIRADLTAAMKSRDAATTSTLRMVQAAIQNEKIEKGRDLSDEEAEAVLRRAVKQRQDSVEQYRKGGREDLAEREEAEIALLRQYLPQTLTDAELESIVEETIASTGATSKKDAGRVMKEIMAAHRGRADGRKVQEIVGRKLG